VTLFQTLLVGSYTFGLFVWGFMWREFRALRREVETMRLQMAEREGLERGYDHERRITRLERFHHAPQAGRSPDA